MTSAYVRRKERSQVGNLTFHLKELGKESPQPQASRRKERTKTRAEINAIETKMIYFSKCPFQGSNILQLKKKGSKCMEKIVEQFTMERCQRAGRKWYSITGIILPTLALIARSMHKTGI